MVRRWKFELQGAVSLHESNRRMWLICIDQTSRALQGGNQGRDGTAVLVAWLTVGSTAGDLADPVFCLVKGVVLCGSR